MLDVRKMKQYVRLPLALLVFVGILSGNAQSQSTKVPLKLGIMKLASMTNIYAAQKLGYFGAQDLDVNLSTLPNGQVLMTALSTGDLDIALASAGAAMAARDKGGISVVLAMQNEVSNAKGPDQGGLLVRRDSGITSVNQLAGKTIGYGAINNQQWAGVHDVLEKHGVDLKSIREIEIPLSQMQAALDHKLVDAVSAYEPFVTVMLESKQARVVSWNFAESVAGQPNGAFFAMAPSAEKIRLLSRSSARRSTVLPNTSSHIPTNRKN
jgi:NitT/TauT family transport system substrate-binding protein